jgi:hypothetical protein
MAWWNQMLLDLPVGLDNAKSLGLAVVIDLHQLPDDSPTTYSSDEYQNSHLWWQDQENLNGMLECWGQIATICKGRDQVIWFDLWNEPLDWTTVHSSPSYPPAWPNWAQQIINHIRTIDTQHPVVVEPGPGMLSWGFTGFPLLSDSYQDVIYSVHVYQPVEYTHQGVNDTTIYGWPGTWGGGNGDLFLATEYAAARLYQLIYGVRIWVGEFSAARWAPGAANYLRDCAELFESYDWDWSYFSFDECSVWNLEDTNNVDLYDANGNYVTTGLATVGSGLHYAPYGTPEVVPVAEPEIPTNRAAVIKEFLDLNSPTWNSILHGIPCGDFTNLATLSLVVPNSNNPGGWWGNYADAAASVSLAGAVGTWTRHCELSTQWMDRQAAVWYVDYFSTPTNKGWEIRSDLSWNGSGTSGGTSHTFALIPGQDPNASATFRMCFSGTQVTWTTPTASGTFTSWTGINATARRVSIEYNPMTGIVIGKFGSETVFSGVTTTGLSIQTVRLSTKMASNVYNPGTLSVDNVIALVCESPVLASILHSVPKGNFNDLATLSEVVPSSRNPGGWWGNYADAAASASLVGAVGTSARHCELSTLWLERQASVWYIDYFSTPTDKAWKIRSDLSWNGSANGGTSNIFSLIAGQNPNVSATFSMSFTGTQVAWTTPTDSGTFTSATGLDSTTRSVSIEYDPYTGFVRGKFGTETVFGGLTTTNLTVQTIRINTAMPLLGYDPGVLSIDNLTAVECRPVPTPSKILHGIPCGNFSDLAGVSSQIVPSADYSWGFWDSFADTWGGCSTTLVGDVDTDARHYELFVNWMNRQASVWYADCYSTPNDQPWKVHADLKWVGSYPNTNENMSLYVYLLPNQNVNGTAIFTLRFYGYKVDCTTPSGTTTFTSTTGLDSTYRQVGIQYNPLTGSIQATVGNETIFSGTTITGLTVQTVKITALMGSQYNAGTLSIDNMAAE